MTGSARASEFDSQFQTGHIREHYAGNGRGSAEYASELYGGPVSQLDREYADIDAALEPGVGIARARSGST